MNDLIIQILLLFTIHSVLLYLGALGIVKAGNEHLYGVPLTPEYYTKDEARAQYKRFYGATYDTDEKINKALEERGWK